MAALMGGSLVLIAASAGILVVGWLGANPSMIVASMAGLTAAGLLLLVAHVRSRRIAARVVGAPEGAGGPVASSGVRLQPDRTTLEGQAEAAPQFSPQAPEARSEPEIAPLPVPGAASVTAPIEGDPGPEPGPAPSEAAGTRPSASKSTAAGSVKAQGRAAPAKGSAKSAKTSTTKATKKTTTVKASPSASPKRTTAKSSARTTTAKSSAGKGTAKSGAAKQPPKVIVFDGRDKYHRPGCRFAKGRGAEKVTKATARRWGYEPCSICDP